MWANGSCWSRTRRSRAPHRGDHGSAGWSLRRNRFEAALAGWSAALFVDPSPLWSCSTSSSPQPFNFTQFCDPEVDALIAQGLSLPDPAASAPIWREVQARIHEQQPYLFLYWMDELVGVHERFENARVNPLSAYDRLHERAARVAD